MTRTRGARLEHGAARAGLDRSDASEPRGPAARAVLTLLPLALSLVAFLPILANYFFADDFVHFYDVRNDGLVDFITAPQGGHLLLTFNSVFVALAALFGTHPEPFFVVVLATHLLNVWLLARAIRTFTNSRRLGCFGATLWGVSPTNEGSLGWYSVYGHVLVATAALLLLIQLGRIANGGISTWKTGLAWAALLFAAGTSFGVGLGIAMAFPIAVFLVLPPSGGRARLTCVAACVAAALPFLYLELYRWHPSPYDGGSSFESLLAPVVRFWWPSLRLLAHLLIAGTSSLLAGAAFTWDQYPGAFAYALAAGFAVATAGALIVGDTTVRRRILACAVLVLAGYAFIAMGRGSRLSAGSAVPLRTLRYHYAMPAIIALVASMILSTAARGVPVRLSAGAKNALLAAGLLLISGLHLAYAKPIDHHDRARRQTTAALAAIRDRIDAAAPASTVYIPNGDFGGVGPVLRRVPDIFPGWAGVFVVFFPDNTVDGKRVFFIEDRAAVRKPGRRTSDLFVTTATLPQNDPAGEPAS